jgi:hypothetical protein
MVHRVNKGYRRYHAWVQSSMPINSAQSVGIPWGQVGPAAPGVVNQDVSDVTVKTSLRSAFLRPKRRYVCSRGHRGNASSQRRKALRLPLRGRYFAHQKTQEWKVRFGGVPIPWADARENAARRSKIFRSTVQTVRRDAGAVKQTLNTLRLASGTGTHSFPAFYAQFVKERCYVAPSYQRVFPNSGKVNTSVQKRLLVCSLHGDLTTNSATLTCLANHRLSYARWYNLKLRHQDN